MTIPNSFTEEKVNSWEDLLKIINGLSDRWIFRGQPSNDPLRTTLERACKDYGIHLRKAPGIEEHLIRDFRRRYRGDDWPIIQKDTLYCLSLMQHHGAPTRLLDWTYSPFVATYFALEKKVSSGPVVWCLNGDWCEEQTTSLEIGDLISKRNDDKKRTDKTFKPLYMGKKRYKFVLPENPLPLNERLTIQKGLFLCPGNVALRFETNLKSLKGWNSRDGVLKLRFQMKRDAHIRAIKELHRMNVARDSLFPGLDGFAESLKQKLPVYEKMAERGVGKATARLV